LFFTNLLLELPPIGIILAVSLLVIAASIVQAALGMGYGLLAAPFLMLIEPAYVPGPTILIGMVSSSLGAWSERQHIIWPEVVFASLGRLSGVVVAVILLAFIATTGQFRLIFGVLVGLAVILTVCGWKMRHSKLSLLSMGWVSGCMGTITGVGAPPLALIYHDRPPLQARPTLAAFFCIGCALSICGLAITGWLGCREVVLAISLLPAMVVGTWLGRKWSRQSNQRYRQALLALAGIASIILIAQGVYHLIET
jgi:uncharacterized membrane protein YfcA